MALAGREGVPRGGMFGNQKTICRPSAAKWRWTVDRLKQLFPNHANAGA